MISKYPDNEDRQETASLWQHVFHDSDDFVELFFRRVYKPENALVIKRDNRIISALHMVPYQVKIDDHIVPSAYVCGVCTHPSERGKGVMNTLMTEAMDVMRQKGYLISTLIPAEPWLFDVYKKFGYTHPVNYETETYVKGGQSVNTGYTFIECTTDACFPYFDRKQRERRCTVLHDKYDFETIIRDLHYDQGHTWIALKENNPVGIAFAKPESETTISIKELLYDNITTKEALINHIINQYNARMAKILLPSDPQKNTHTTGSVRRQTHPYGLACILNEQIDDISDLYMTLMLD